MPLGLDHGPAHGAAAAGEPSRPRINTLRLSSAPILFNNNSQHFVLKQSRIHYTGKYEIQMSSERSGLYTFCLVRKHEKQ